MSKAGQRQLANRQHNQKLYELGVKFGKGEISYVDLEGIKATRYAWTRYRLGVKHGEKEVDISAIPFSVAEKLLAPHVLRGRSPGKSTSVKELFVQYDQIVGQPQTDPHI